MTSVYRISTSSRRHQDLLLRKDFQGDNGAKFVRMILSHDHKFVFLKTRKTAGTSIEIALSQFCGGRDIITRITDNDEALRQQLGFRGPQKFIVNPLRYRLVDLFRLPKHGRARMNNHDPASLVRKYVGGSIFDSYHKFTVVRNPWDMAVSMYYWQMNSEDSQFSSDMDFKSFIREAPNEILNNSHVYLINNESVIDTFIRFESLVIEWKELTDKLGFGEVELPRAKTSTRKDKSHYSTLYDDDDIEYIANLCSWEIERFGYEFDDRRVN